MIAVPARIALPLLAIALPLLAAMPSASVAAEPRSILPLSAFPRETIAVETRSARRHVFDAWRADTPETRAQGLMYVHEMRPVEAMIFLYDPPQAVGMWMKNTLIPLDMLFADESGCIVKVEREARPQSLDTIATRLPVAVVVELKGGTAKALGIDVGDRVVRPDAGWPGSDFSCTGPR
jgi:hypothetical protein